MVHLQLDVAYKRCQTFQRARSTMASLIEKVGENADPEAFRELFDEFAPRVKAMMLRKGMDADTAEEIAQETMLTVWRKADMFSASRGALSTWIFTIARNHSIDRFRRQAPWRSVDIDLTLQESDDVPPDEQVMRRQSDSRVRNILEMLPEEQQLVIRLSYEEGLSQSEIASTLDLPLGTVKSRMRLAYQRIRTAFEED